MVLIMDRKKVFLLLISLVLMLSLVSGVNAQRDSFLPDVIEDWARFFFIDLSDLAFGKKLRTGFYFIR